MNPALVGRVLLERLSCLFDHDLSDGTGEEEGKADVLHPVGGQGVRLAARNLVDEDERVDGVEETVVGRYESGHSWVEG